jgi:hypothetical protein
MMLGEPGYGHNMHKARALTHVGTLNSGPAALPAHQRYAHGLQKKEPTKLHDFLYPSFLEDKRYRRLEQTLKD